MWVKKLTMTSNQFNDMSTLLFPAEKPMNHIVHRVLKIIVCAKNIVI